MPKPKKFAKFLEERGVSYSRLALMYRQNCEEARKLREAIGTFTKAVNRVHTPSEKARRRKQAKKP